MQGRHIYRVNPPAEPPSPGLLDETARVQVITVYLPDYLHKQRGLSIERATIVGVIFGVATTVGQLGGAQLGQRLYNRRARLQPLLMGVRELIVVRGNGSALLFAVGFRRADARFPLPTY